MAETHYHLDRLGVLTTGTQFELSTTPVHPAAPHDALINDGRYDRVTQTDQSLIEALFPGGLSSHGKRLLYRHIDTSRTVLQAIESAPLDGLVASVLHLETQGLSRDWCTELIFEAVRRRRYPEACSRFQAVFGAPTPAALEAWLGLPQVHSTDGEMYRVSADYTTVRDARLLEGGNGNSFDLFDRADGLIAAAERYWAGEMTADPVPETLLQPPVSVTEFCRSIESPPVPLVGNPGYNES